MHKNKWINMKAVWILTFLVCLLLIASNSLAKVYHIDPNTGKSSNNGTALSPLKSWSDLPAMNKGDDVFFKCDTTYSPSSNLKISWEGTESNPVEIGAYYIEGGKAVYGVKGNRPVISGNGHKVPGNSCFGSSNTWQGLIQVDSKDYIHIKNIHIYQSGFRGISINGSLDNGTNAAYFVIKNVKVEDSYGPGIIVDNNSKNYGLIEGCEVTGSGYSWKKGCEDRWPIALVVFGSPYSYTTIKKNYVHENWGEGIGSGKVACQAQQAHSGFAVIEDNVVWSNRRVDIYISKTEHNIVKSNLLVGNADSTYSSTTDQRSWQQFGIWLNLESRGDCPNDNHNNFIYDNYVAGHYKGIGVGSSYDSGRMENIYIFNNISIANRYNYSIGGLENYQTKNIVLKNNVSFCPSGTMCTDVDRDQGWISSKIIADYNAWEKQPRYWAGPHDQTTDNKWTKTSGWQSLSSIPEKSDFLPESGNVCIEKGTPMTNIDYPSASLTEQLKKDIAIVSGWDIGAGLFSNKGSDSAGDGKIPAPILRVKEN